MRIQSLSYLNKYLFKYKSFLIWGILFVVLSNVFAIIPAQVVRHAFDLVNDTVSIYHLFKGTNAEPSLYEVFGAAVLTYGVLVVLMALTRGVFLFFMRQTIIVMSRLVEFDLKNEIYAHYQTLPLSFYRSNNTGDLMARISEDVGQVRMYLGPAIMYGINMLGSTVLIIAYMLIVNEKLTFYTLLPLPLLSISIFYVNNWINKYSTQIQKNLSNMSTFVQEAFSGIRIIKAFAREENSYNNFTNSANEYKKQSLKLAMVNALFAPLIFTLVGISTIMVVYIGGIEVIEGTVTTGNIAEFIIYVNMLTWPVTSLGWISSIAQRAAVSQDRINEFLNTKNDLVSTENLAHEIKGAITFKNVSLTYKDSGIQALQHINLQVQAGESLAILGTTGSGKSTIAALVCRMYDSTQGEILIDGIDIKKYNIPHLRSQIGYVPQDVFLFSETIKNNIIFGSEHLTDEQVIEAAKNADLYDNIKDFPKGFETELGERGITLSGGQKQRTSIARAIIRNPKILILDDCLSAVDTKTENIILNNLSRIMENRTSVIISHRVSSAKLADKIVVLDGGRIIQEGTHASLINTAGMYKELYDKQLQGEEVTG
jgi:ATP-binding cassette, subfamily B, multidrug efflux pump